MIGIEAFLRRTDTQLHLAFFRELEGVRQEVLQHLLQTFRIGDDTAVER